MKKGLMSAVILVFILSIVSACSEGDATSKSDNLIFTTGTTSGVFYPLGAIVSTLWEKKLGQRVTSQASNGSVENLNLMRKGEANIGFSTVNIVWEAYNGEASFKDQKYEDVRILANLYPNVNHIIAREGTGIEKIEDIKGKSFVLGAAGSATEIESKLVLKAHGVDINDVKENYVGFTEAVDLLRNKQVHAVNIYTGVPAAAATELISTVDSRVLSFSDDAIKSLVDEFPWNFEYTIEANTYDKQTEEIKTIGQFSTIIVDSSVSEETAYQLTKELWENLDELEKGHSIVKQFDPKLAVEGTAGVPLHPGAEKYYKETGILK